MKFLHIRCNKKFSKTLSLGVLCAAAAGSSMAAGTSDQSGFYLGSGIGYSTISPKFDDPELEQNISQKKRDLGFKLYGGYQFNENWAIETQYINLGKYRDEGFGSMKGRKLSAKVYGLAFNGVGSYHFNEQWSILGKFGVMASVLDISRNDGGFSSKGKNSRGVLLAGFGAEYRFTPQLSLRAEYEYYGAHKSVDDVKISNDMATLGLRYRF